MGYDQSNLQRSQVGTAGSPATVFVATDPCFGSVVGLPDVKFEMKPVFSPSEYVLWGRSDFMAVFDVSISEKTQEFAIEWDEPSESASVAE